MSSTTKKFGRYELWNIQYTSLISEAIKKSEKQGFREIRMVFMTTVEER
jgi:hypothetical protein